MGGQGAGGRGQNLRISKPQNQPLPITLALPRIVCQKERGLLRITAQALGSGSDGRLGLFVDRSDRLSVQWSLAGQRDSSGVLLFLFEIPAAASNRLFVELPNALMPKIDRGLILGSKAVDAQSRCWQIELGGNDRLQLRVVPVGAAHSHRQLALLRESRTYDCSSRGLEVSAQWKLQVYNEPLQRISVLLDPKLQLMSAHLGDVAIPWSAARKADGGTRITLRLPEPIRDTDRVIRLGAAGRTVLDRPWRLPRIRAEGLLWLEGSISLLTPEPLATDRIVPLSCARRASAPCRPRGSGSRCSSNRSIAMRPSRSRSLALRRRWTCWPARRSSLTASRRRPASQPNSTSPTIRGSRSPPTWRPLGSSIRSSRFPRAACPTGRSSRRKTVASGWQSSWRPGFHRNSRCNWPSPLAGLSRRRAKG